MYVSIGFSFLLLFLGFEIGTEICILYITWQSQVHDGIFLSQTW